MISDDDLLNKCINGDQITCEDLGIHPNLSNCDMVIETGFGIFYTDGVNYYDINGNKLGNNDIRKLLL